MSHPALSRTELVQGIEALDVLARSATQVEAERRSGISRAKLRSRVLLLERELAVSQPGTKLVDSVQGKGTVVTAAGKRLLQAWEPGKRATDHAASLLAKPHIRAFPQHLFPALLERWADGDIHVDIAPENDRLTDRFRESLADVASGLPMISIGPEIRDVPTGVAAHPFYDTPYWVLSPDDRPLWTLEELAAGDCDLLLAPTGTRSRDALDAATSGALTPVLESFSPMALVKTAYVAAANKRRAHHRKPIAVCLPGDIALRFSKDELFGHGLAEHLTWAPLKTAEGVDFTHRVFAYSPTHRDERIAIELGHLWRYIDAATKLNPGAADQQPDAYRPLAAAGHGTSS